MRGLLLDFGSVISVSLFERHRDTERRLGLPVGSLTWLGPIDPSTDALWRALQLEEISEREYWARRAVELGGPGWSMLDLLQKLAPEDPNQVVRPEMQALIAEARRCGLRVGVLSNELELFYGPVFVAALRVLRDMTAIVDATHTGVLKPDPRAYAAALDALDLPAHEVLFVDDQFRNIAGAVRAGLQTQFFDLRAVAGNIAAIRARLSLPREIGIS